MHLKTKLEAARETAGNLIRLLNDMAINSHSAFEMNDDEFYSLHLKVLRRDIPSLERNLARWHELVTSDKLYVVENSLKICCLETHEGQNTIALSTIADVELLYRHAMCRACKPECYQTAGDRFAMVWENLSRDRQVRGIEYLGKISVDSLSSDLQRIEQEFNAAICRLKAPVEELAGWSEPLLRNEILKKYTLTDSNLPRLAGKYRNVLKKSGDRKWIVNEEHELVHKKTCDR